MDEGHSESLLNVAGSNCQAFISEFEKYQGVDQFLKRPDDRFISCRSAYLSEAEATFGLNYKLDTDGIVAELGTLHAIQFPFRYLQFLPNGKGSIVPIFSVLKKHVDFSRFNVEALKRCKGIQLISDYGWQIYAVLVPMSNAINRMNHHLDLQMKYFMDVKKSMEMRLCNLGSCDMSRATLKKNKLTDIKKWHVMPDDRSFILGLLQQSFVEIDRPRGLEVKLFAFRFGEREVEDIYLDQYFACDRVVDISIHTAVTISPIFPRMHLMWARKGIEEVVGERGVLSSVFTFREACNFQSNLDSRGLDMKEELQRVCKYADKLTFMQLYVDSPHMYTRCAHPVSGGIITCGLLHHESERFLNKQAEEYLVIARENAMKLVGTLSIRLETVCRVTCIPSVIRPEHFLSVANLKGILTAHPKIVPIYDTTWVSRSSVMYSLQRVASFMVDNLSYLKDNYWNKGGFLPSWSSYQLELANEMFWWGKPNSVRDDIYSINLGPGISAENRSTTHSLGFLRLDAVNACTAHDETLPPLHYWTKSEIVKERIRRMFTFSDFLSSHDRVLGSRMLQILCSDILNDKRRPVGSVPRTLLSDLRAKNVPVWAEVKGCISAEQLSKQLGKKELFKFPFVFGHAIKVVHKNARNVVGVIHAGMSCLKLNFFPQFHSYDKHRNHCFSWVGNGLLRVVHDKPDSGEICYQLITSEIIDILESRDLAYKSTFVRNNVNHFPWIESVYVRLGQTALIKSEKVLILAFVTCIALLQNGKFVHLVNMRKLLFELPLSQAELQRLEILSLSRLPNVFNAIVYRLHDSIPVLIELTDKPSSSRNDVEDSIDEKDIPGHESTPSYMEVDDREQVIVRVVSRHVPSGSKVSWTNAELNVVDDVMEQKTSSQTWKSLYRQYTEICHKRHLCDRTFGSFKSACFRYNKAKHE